MRIIIYTIDIFMLVLACTYYNAVAVYIYLQNRRSIGNITFALMLFFLGQWALSHFFVVYNTNPQLTVMFYRWAFVPSVFVAAFVAYFILAYPKDQDIPNWAKILIFILPLLITFISLFTDLMIKDFQILDPNYIYLGKRVYGPFYTVFILYQSIFVLGAVLIAVIKAVRSKGRNKIIMSYVATAFLISGIAGLMFAGWLPRIGLEMVYSLGPISSIFGVSLIAYAILKYGLFSVTPQVAAEEILGALGQSVLVCDVSGNIIYQGEETATLDLQQRKDVIKELIEKGDLFRHKIVLQGMPFNISASFFREGGGVVMLLYDVTELEEEGEKEAFAHDKLSKRYEKEKMTREILSRLISKENKDQILRSAVEIFGEDPETMRTLEHMANMIQGRKQMLAELEAGLKKKAIENDNSFKEIERINRELIQKELKMVEIKEKIAEVKKYKS